MMSIKTYHFICFTLFVSLLFSSWFCVLVVAVAWTFQLAHSILVSAMLARPRYEGVDERLKREYYAKSSVSILKPLCGTTPTLYENLRSYFTLKYPSFELILCVADENDEALRVVKRLQREFPDVSTIISVGEDDVGINPKLCNMNTGYKVANHDLVWIADANIVASDAALHDMVDKCVSGARLVHQIPWAVSGTSAKPAVGAMSCGSILERWYFATAHGRPYTVINNTVCTCLNGMSNLFTKAHMDEIGGLENFGEFLNEDGEIGLTYDRHGYETAISQYVAVQNIGPIEISDYASRRVRWVKLRNKYPNTAWTSPLELLIDNHLTSLLCLIVLVYYHGVGVGFLVPLHQTMWLAVDAVVFMLMDRATAFPNMWQGYRLDWGRVSKRRRGIYFYILNIIEHYTMWLTREYITMYIRLQALESTDTIVWQDKEIEIPEPEAADETKVD